MEFGAEMLRKVMRAEEPSMDAFVNRISSEPEPEKIGGRLSTDFSGI